MPALQLLTPVLLSVSLFAGWLCVPCAAQEVASSGVESLRLRDLGEVPAFSLVDQAGQPFGREQLAGKVWVADFIFTRCGGPCPVLSATFSRMQRRLPKGVHLVSFTVDPDYDRPEILTAYAKQFDARAERWTFLTGDAQAIRHLIINSFHLAIESSPDAEAHLIQHTVKFMLVDGQGRIRGYYDGLEDADVEGLIEDTFTLSGRWPPVAPLYLFPPLNAALNAICFGLLICGFVLVKRRKLNLHKVCMVTAFLVSMLFLASYLYYHSYHGATRFQKTGAIRTLYLAILLTHTVLAAAVPFLAVGTIYFGVRELWTKHVRIARWTLPIWLYVSVTGVVIYWMLYQL